MDTLVSELDLKEECIDHYLVFSFDVEKGYSGFGTAQ
jgi:hypothetical protein